MRPFPNDSGPIYTETRFSSGFPAEPWNTASNLIFLLILLTWLWRMRRPEDRHAFLLWAMPLLAVGFVGGTVYHATRSHDLWFLMDFVPIALLVLFAAIHAWSLLGNWPLALGCVAGLNVGARLFVDWLDPAPMLGISLGYALFAANLVLPLGLSARRSQWRAGGWLLASAGLIAAALGFRQFDEAAGATWRHGTHFLWHLLGGCSVQCLCEYLYRSSRVTRSS